MDFKDIFFIIIFIIIGIALAIGGWILLNNILGYFSI